jgi:AcrR family transcriptional regulator
MGTVMSAVATTVTNRRTPRSELRRRIETAAMDLWRDEGFEAVSVESIVNRAGVSKGAFFIFFRTKAEALGVYAQALSERMQPARAMLDPARPLSSLDAFAMAAQAVLHQEGELARTLYRELGGRAYVELSREDLAAFTGFVAEAQAHGRFDEDIDPAVAGGALCDLWSATLLAWAAGGQTGDLAAILRPRLRLLVCGLGSRG